MTPEQGAAVAKQMNAKYLECSAKEQKGVAEVFEVAIDTVVKAEDASYETKPSAPGKRTKKAKKKTCRIL